jgi:cytochrome c oxidase subunit 2
MAERQRRFVVFALVCAALGLAFLTLTSPAFAQNYPQTALEPRSDVAAMQDRLWDDILLWVVGIFVVVETALIVTVVRFRRRPGGPAAKPIHGNTTLEILWTIAPAVILAFIAVPTVRTIFQTYGKPAGTALEVRVVGHQWWWEFQYPQLGVITANELHVPSGRTVYLTLEAADVIHSFWIPAFGGKRDVIPGRTNHMWFTPKATGSFPGQCAEFCGASHANMLFKVVSQSQAEFDAWVATQKAPVAPPDSTSLAAKGFEVYQKGQCVACHMIDGVSYGVLGPNLSKVATRTTIASGIFPNDEEHLKRWIKNAPAQKPGSLMPNMNLTDEQVAALVAYLQTRR